MGLQESHFNFFLLSLSEITPLLWKVKALPTEDLFEGSRLSHPPVSCSCCHVKPSAATPRELKLLKRWLSLSPGRLPEQPFTLVMWVTGSTYADEHSGKGRGCRVWCCHPATRQWARKHGKSKRIATRLSQQRDSFIESKTEVNFSSYFLTEKLTKRFYCNSYSDLTVTDVWGQSLVPYCITWLHRMTGSQLCKRFWDHLV